MEERKFKIDIKENSDIALEDTELGVSPETSLDFIIEKCIEIKEEAFSKELLDEFYKLKEALNSDFYLEKRNEIEEAKEKEDKSEYKKLYEEYNSDPLVKEYEKIKEEVLLTLVEIKDEIDEKLKV